MISVNNLSIEFNSRPLFSDVSFVVNKNEKIALVGKNGAGKSTLLKILAGELSPSIGSIGKENNITIGFLPQHLQLKDDSTLKEEVKKAFSNRLNLSDEIEKIHQKLESGEFDTEEYNELIDRLNYLEERLSIENVNSIEGEIEKTLIGLGFTRNDFYRQTREFSGGWRMRIELAKLLLQNHDLLLLDEPTNHLDIESIQWLEQFLKNKANAVIIVSHDKAFIDNVTNRTIEISCGKIYDYKVNYSSFKELRKERIEQQTRAYENQRKQIEEIQQFINRFRYKPSKAVQVQSRIKQLEKIDIIEIDEVDNSRLRLKFPPAERSGDFPLIIENLSKSYGELNVLQNVNLTLRRGDKVAFVGKNGSGKTTMVKSILNEIEHSGTAKIGHNVKIGYFAQDQARRLDDNLTVFETIDNVAVGDIRTKIKDILGAFLFRGDDIDKKVKVLSGGEKTRLSMIKLLLQPVNFLILDEPTNHLDMRTKEVVKEAIEAFDGTVIIVSHDRDFLDGLVNKVYEFGDGKVKEHLGGIYDFLQTKNLSLLKDLEKIEKFVNNKSELSKTEISEGKLSYQEQKEYEKKLKRLKKSVEEAEKRIEEFDLKIRELEDRIGNGEVSSDIISEYEAIKKSSEKAFNDWEKAQYELDNFEK